MSELKNIFEQVIAASARVREIKQIRYNSLDTGTYRLDQYRKVATPSDIAEQEIQSGTIGRDYLMRAVSKTTKRNREYNKYKNR